MTIEAGKQNRGFPFVTGGLESDTQPAHSYESEAAVLGAMVYDHAALCMGLSSLKVEHFYTTTHGVIFKAIGKAFASHGKVDAVLVKDALGGDLDAIGGAAYLMTLVEQFPVASSADAYAKVVLERYHQRRIADAADKLRRKAISLASLEDLASAGVEVGRALAGAVGESEESTASVVERAFIGVEDRAKMGKPEFSWGIGRLDEAMGGLRRRETYVIAAKTSHLKTGLALTLARANAKGDTKILYACVENLEQIPLRLAALNSMLPLDWYLRPYRCTEDQMKLVRASKGDLSEMLSRITIVGLERVAQITAKLAMNAYDIIIVDYLQRLKEVVEVKERHTAASAAFHTIYKLASRHNCVVVVLSQVTIPDDFRGKHKAPTIENLRESGDISQFADGLVIGFWLWRDTLDDKDRRESYEVSVAKSKMGACGKFTVSIDPQSLRFVG